MSAEFGFHIARVQLVVGQCSLSAGKVGQREPQPLARFGRVGRQVYPPVGHAIQPPERAHPHLVAARQKARLLALVAHEPVGAHYRPGRQQVGVRPLRDAVTLPRHQHQNRPKSAQRAARIVARRERGQVHRRRIVASLRPLKPGYRLRYRVNPRTLAVRPVPSVGGYVRLDETRIQPFQRIGVQSHPVRRARPHVGEDSVGVRRQPTRYLPSFLGSRVHGNAPLVGVERYETRSARGPGYISVRRLELHHVRPQVSQQTTGHRPRYHIRHFHDPNAGQRQPVARFRRRFAVRRPRRVLDERAQARLRRLASANPARRRGQLYRQPRRVHLAQRRVVQFTHKPIVEYLRVAHRLFRRPRQVARNVRRAQFFYPFVGGARSERVRHQIEQPLSRALVPGPATVSVLRAGRDGVRHPDDGGGYVHESRMYAAQLKPLPIRALKHAVERPAALRRHVHRTDWYRVARRLRGIEKRARHQRSLHAPAAPRHLPPVYRRRHAHRGEQPGAHVRHRMRHVDRPPAPGRLAAQYPYSRRRQVVVGGFVSQRPLFPIRRYRAVNQPGISRRQPVQPKARPERRRRRQVLYQDVRVGAQRTESVRVRLRVEHDRLLSPVVEREYIRLARRAALLGNQPDDARAVVREEHRG